MKPLLLLAFSLGMLAAPPCVAAHDHDDGDEDFDRPRVYFGVGPLWARENFDADTRLATGASVEADADDSWGADARIGYRAHRHVAVELHGQYYGNFDLSATVPGITGSQSVGSLEGFGVTNDVKVFPTGGRVQPYLLGGVGFMWARLDGEAPGAGGDREELEFAARGGLGIDFYLDENFSANIESSYLAPTSTLQDFGLIAVTAGLQFHLP